MGTEKGMQAMVETIRAWVTSHADAPCSEASLARELFDGLCEALWVQEEPPHRIAAQNAVVELMDQETGRLYRRYLELEYEENDNGIRLGGEDLAGKPIQVVFLSNKALEKLHDLRGQGPDAPRCGHDHS